MHKLEGRQVAVYKYSKGGKKEISYHGTFLAFGVDYEEFEDGPGNFSTAIVEQVDGNLENVYINQIKFLD